MKKFLLPVVFAFAAMTASAQALSEAPSGMISKKFTPSLKLASKAADLKSSFKDMSDLRAKLHKAPTQSDLYGTYVEDAAADIHSCGAATLDAYEYTDDETGETYEYVEVVLDASYTNSESVNYVDVLGEYDADAKTLTVPGSQYCYEVTKTDYYYSTFGSCKFAILNLICDANGDPETIDDSDLVFDVNDDGSLTLQNDGYYIYMDGGSYDGYCFNYNTGVSLYPANATQGYYWSRPSWGERSTKAYVEDYKTSVGVYGFCDVAYCEMLINDDLSVTIETPQPMIEIGLTDEDEIATYGEYLNLLPCEVDNGYLVAQFDGSPIEGTLSGNTISIGGQDTDHQTYFTMMSNLDEEEICYGNGYYVYYQLVLDNGNFLADGIKEVNGTREDQIKNTKTYNLMGQQVNRDSAKGLLIYGGKKYIKK